MSLMSDIGAAIKLKFDKNAVAMTKAQFNALADERRANRAGSGFDEFGKSAPLSTTVSLVNEGLWTLYSSSNIFFLGRNAGYADGVGTSKSYIPICNVNGNILSINSINANNTQNQINLPAAPTIYPSTATLTAEQIASGVIKHADSSNSGLIVNGKFDTDTSGWSASITGSVSIDSGTLKITASGSDRYAYQGITCVIGKEYIVEFNGKCSDQYGTLSVATTTAFGTPIVNYSLLNNSSNMDRYTFKFTATATTMYIRPKMGAANSIAYFDNIAVYPADAISRSDLVFLESWHEDVSEKNFVYPLGNVQYLGVNTDGLTGIVNGSFTGFETYSLFGNWQTPSALIGKGYVWSSLTEAQRKAFIANPENNCYLDGDKVIQVRYRVRVVQGLGDNWTQMSNLAKRISGDDQSALLYSSASNYIRAIGKNTVPIDYSATPSLLTFAFPTSNRNLGTYSTEVSNTSTAYEGKCYALPIALVHRRNQGMFHNVYNPNGTKLASDGLDCFRTSVSFTSISDCFDPAKLLTASGYIGTVSGRPDGLFYDQVHEGDITDLRNSSKKPEDYNRLTSREFNKLVAGTYRGKEGEKLFQPITFTNCGFIQYGSPVGTKQAYRILSSSSFMPKWHSYWGSSVYGNINQLFGGVVPTIPFAIILAKKDGTNYFIEVSPSSTFVDLVVFRTLDGTPTLPNVGNLVELVFDEITWLWLPSAYEYIGASYGHKNSIISTRTKSNTLLHCDIIGNPSNYPASWKQNGVFGTPLIVAEDGTSLLPDGVRDTFKLSRKANATPLLCLRSTDNGATWTSFTPTFSTTTNALTLTDEPASNLVMVYYQTHTSMAVPTVNSEVLEIGDVYASCHNNKAVGNDLFQTLLSKSGINTGDVTFINSIKVPNTTISNSGKTLFATSNAYNNTHSSILLQTSPVVYKVFPYLTRTNGKAYLNLVFKEMKHNGTSWGDDNKFNIVDNVSTTTDLNAQTVLIGQKTVELPYFIGADE